VKGYIGLTATKNWIDSNNKTKYSFNYQCSIGGLYYNGDLVCKGPVMVHNQPYDIIHNKNLGTLSFYSGKELLCQTPPFVILKSG